MKQSIAFLLILLAALSADSMADKPLLLALPIGIAAVLTLWPEKETAPGAGAAESGKDQPERLTKIHLHYGGKRKKSQ